MIAFSISINLRESPVTFLRWIIRVTWIAKFQKLRKTFQLKSQIWAQKHFINKINHRSIHWNQQGHKFLDKTRAIRQVTVPCRQMQCPLFRVRFQRFLKANPRYLMFHLGTILDLDSLQRRENVLRLLRPSALV